MRYWSKWNGAFFLLPLTFRKTSLPEQAITEQWPVLSAFELLSVIHRAVRWMRPTLEAGFWQNDGNTSFLKQGG